MMKIIEPEAIQIFYQDVLKGQRVNKSEKYLRDNAFLFQDCTGVDLNQPVYTVYTHIAGSSEKMGELYWGTTILEPLLVNEECNMTKGHFHINRNCAEYYFGISGDGLLLLMDETGNTWAEKVYKGSLHHIDGKLAHRLVNTGDAKLEVGACWPTMAGHDYEAVLKQPFGYRIFRHGNIIETMKVSK